MPVLGLSVGLFLLTAALPTLLIGCIEGGVAVGFPAPFYGGCNSAIGVPSPRMWIPGFLVLDLVVWYVVSWGILQVVRDRRVPRSP